MNMSESFRLLSGFTITNTYYFTKSDFRKLSTNKFNFIYLSSLCKNSTSVTPINLKMKKICLETFHKWKT